MNIEELKRLGEKWANLPYCEESRDIEEDVMLKLPELLHEMQQLEKAAAEMRQLALAICDYKKNGYTGIDIDLALEVIASSTCGSDYIHKREIEPLVEALRNADNHLNALGTSGKHKTRLEIMSALAHSESLLKQP